MEYSQMTKLEKDIEKRFVNYAQKHKCLAVKFADPSKIGAPDRLILAPKGIIFFIEFKRPGEKPNPHQLLYHNMLYNLGFQTYICDSFEKAKTVLDKVLGFYYLEQ